MKAIRYRNDIETNLFKRYFCTWLHWFLSGMKMLRSKNETLLAENNKQRKEILNLQEKISQLDRIVIEKRLSIRELKKEQAKDQTEMSQLTDTILSREREICELKKDQAKSQTEMSQLKDTILSREREICELKKDQAKKQKTITDALKKEEDYAPFSTLSVSYLQSPLPLIGRRPYPGLRPPLPEGRGIWLRPLLPAAATKNYSKTQRLCHTTRFFPSIKTCER